MIKHVYYSIKTVIKHVSELVRSKKFWLNHQINQYRPWEWARKQRQTSLPLSRLLSEISVPVEKQFQPETLIRTLLHSGGRFSSVDRLRYFYLNPYVQLGSRKPEREGWPSRRTWVNLLRASTARRFYLTKTFKIKQYHEIYCRCSQTSCNSHSSALKKLSYA